MRESENNYKKSPIIILISIFLLTFIFTLFLYLFENNILEYLIPNNFESLFNSDIYSISINIYTFLITILFSLIGIYISKISKFNLSASDYLKHLWYYIVVFTYVIVLIIVNIFFDFYGLKFPHNIFSLVALTSSILILFPLTIRTIYSMSSENYFELILGNLQNYIRVTSKQGNASSIPEKYYDGLILKLNILFENLIATIDNKNDFIITKKILEEIPKIVQTHLIETNNILFKDDQRLVSTLSDNYEFVFRSIKNSYNEKLYEYLVISVGQTSMAFHNDVKKFKRNYEIHLLYLLVEFYYKTFHLKRTSVCNDIIGVFSNHIFTHDEKNNISHNSYTSFLVSIEEFLLKNIDGPNDFWANMNYRNIIGIKRKRFLIFLKQISKLDHPFLDKYHIQNHIQRFFKDFANGINEVKKKSNHLEVIYPCIFGVDSFVTDIAKLNLDKLEKDEQKFNVNNYIVELIRFYRNIILTEFNKNEFSVYNFYSEFIYLVLYRVDLLKDDTEKCIGNVFEIALENINLFYSQSTSKRINLPSDLEDHFVDSLAILLFNYRDKKKQDLPVITKIIEKVLETFGKFETKYKTDFYPVMKLIGCWINYSIELDTKITAIFNSSIANFSKMEDDIYIRSTGTSLQMYNYHTDGMFNDEGYFLNPSALWDGTFQKEVSDFLNQDMKIYEKYHNELLKRTGNGN